MARRPESSGRGGEREPARTGPANAPKFRPRTPKGTTFKKPPLELFTTTLWEYPSQHYMTGAHGADAAVRPGVQGDPNYAGATPSWVIWQVLQRYTKPGERVLDPMCGSGTTLDVCADLGRAGRGFDIAPAQPEIERADARRLPLPDDSCDFVFIDPPYSTHIEYSDDPACIGRLDAGGPGRGEAYYAAMRQVIGEIRRVLRPGRCMALYVSDSWRKGSEPRRGGRGEAQPDARRIGPAGGEFMPIGFELFSIMRERFEPVDIVAVVRQNAKLRKGKWHEAAAAENFFLRGFNYLFIMQKPGKRGPDVAEGTRRTPGRERGGAEGRGATTREARGGR
ncbi:MAG TPA: class I SAM-dependent methyltransferase [Phycisphaerales bacterium]|nr:class I SAM-dependent methyltransferase [Phycisphaerales bacterium]